MRYISAQDILFIHSVVVEETGGAHGVRDVGLLASIIQKPQAQHGGKDLYGDAFQKAAVYLESCANYHVFIDGNKRTGFAVAVRFLSLQGYTVKVPEKEVVAYMVGVATKEYGVDDIAMWLKQHSV